MLDDVAFAPVINDMSRHCFNAGENWTGKNVTRKPARHITLDRMVGVRRRALQNWRGAG